MHIIGKDLTTCQVDASGEFLRLHLRQHNGKASSVTLPIDCARSLLMTLPGVIKRALQARYGDEAYTLVYPAGGWKLQQSADSGQVILTLRTEDGFEVAFALGPRDAGDLASSLANVDVASDDRTIVVN